MKLGRMHFNLMAYVGMTAICIVTLAHRADAVLRTIEINANMYVESSGSIGDSGNGSIIINEDGWSGGAVEYVFILPSTSYVTYSSIQIGEIGEKLAWNGVDVQVFNPNTGGYDFLYRDDTAEAKWKWSNDIGTSYLIDSSDPEFGDEAGLYKAIKVKVTTPPGLNWDRFELQKVGVKFQYSSSKKYIDQYYTCLMGMQTCRKFATAVKQFDLWSSGNSTYTFYGQAFVPWVGWVCSLTQNLIGFLGPKDPSSLLDFTELANGLASTFNAVFSLDWAYEYTYLHGFGGVYTNYTGPLPVGGFYADYVGLSERLNEISDKFGVWAKNWIDEDNSQIVQTGNELESLINNEIEITYINSLSGSPYVNLKIHVSNWKLLWGSQVGSYPAAPGVNHFCKSAENLGDLLVNFFNRWGDLANDMRPPPTIIDDSLTYITPTQVAPSEAFTLHYHIQSSFAEDVDAWLGATIRKNDHSVWYNDVPHDKVITLRPGTDTYSREFTVPVDAPDGVYDVQFGIHSGSDVNNGATWDLLWKDAILTVDSQNHAPERPSNTSPPNGATDLSLTPTLESSVFSDPDPGDFHQASRWQLRTESGTYANPVWDSGADTTNHTRVMVPPGNLSYSTAYYWHVRHQDNHLAWSEWSPETKFTTESALAPPILSVEPSNRNVGATAGSTSFLVSNAGGGVMEWNAEVVSGTAWLSITSESSGTNSGTVQAYYTANPATSSRTGIIRITAAGAAGSPADVTVTQEGQGVITYTLTASVLGGHGTVSPTSGTYEAGTVVLLTASPDTGYRVKAWSGTDNDPSAGSNTNTVTMDSDKTVSVEFEEIPPYTYDYSPWPMFHHDLHLTGRSQYLGAQKGYLKWTYPTSGPIYSSPAVAADGTIYIGSEDGKLYAIYPDGSPKWTYATEDMIRSSPALGSDGTIYVGSLDDKVYAINPDGTLKPGWPFTTGGDVDSSPSIGNDGTIYVGSDDHKLYAINPDGTQKIGAWPFSLADIGDYHCPSIADDGTVYFACSRHLYAINPDGTEKWDSPLGSYHYFSSAAIADDGTVYIGTRVTNKLHAINPENGDKDWSYSTGGWADVSPSIGIDGTIYIGSEDDKLYAINPDGTPKPGWPFTTGRDINSSAAIGADGLIYIGSDDDKFHCINPDGSLKWSYTTGGMVRSSPAIGSDGTIYVGSYDGKLYAFGSIICDFCGANFGPPDGYVDVWDLMQLADHWHTRTGEPQWDSKYDLTGPNFGDLNGYIDVWDLMVFADHWHEGVRP